jgi:16S rRNA U516 pseudouridylate synthase RsuA-like enzyme
MLVLTYLQTTHHLSRRNIVDLIKQGKILINGKPIESFKHELNEGDNVQIINTLKGGKNETMEGSIQTINPESLLSSSQKDNLLLFNKPKGYVVSKSDPHNPTIYELLPPEFQHYYYI